jgi:hypothetical protein
MIAAVFLGHVRGQEPLSLKGIIVHEDLAGARETEPGNPHGSF